MENPEHISTVLESAFVFLKKFQIRHFGVACLRDTPSDVEPSKPMQNGGKGGVLRTNGYGPFSSNRLDSKKGKSGRDRYYGHRWRKRGRGRGKF